MTPILRFISVALLLVGVEALLGQDRSTSSIEGVVLRAGTTEPIARAQVTLMRVPASTGASETTNTTPAALQAQLLPFGSPVVTNSEGKFVFKNPSPGVYRLVASRDGYVRQEYGARQPGQTGTGTVITAQTNQPLTNVVVRLTPTGSVNGRVLSPTDEPMSGMQVVLVRQVYEASGRKTFQTAGDVRTNDRGEYRLYWITPGRYYLCAGPSIGRVSSQSAAGDVRTYATTYFPGTSDLTEALTVDVLSGVDLNAIDIRLRLLPTYRVRGRVVDARTGQSPERNSIGVSILPRQAVLQSGLGGSTVPYNKDGTFEMRNVPAGGYWIRAQAASGAVNPSTSMAPVDVVADDVDGVVLVLRPDVSLTGRVALDGKASAAWPAPMRISLTPPSAGIFPILPAPPTIRPGADGTFAIGNINPGEYRLAIAGLPPSIYVKQARFGGSDILNQAFAIKGSSDTLDIVLGSDPGEVAGTVKDARDEPVSGARVALVPGNQERLDLYKAVTSDASGRFIIRGIVPGDYRLLAWEDLEPYAYFDSMLLDTFGSKGKSISVRESSTQTLDLTAIPGRSQ